MSLEVSLPTNLWQIALVVGFVLIGLSFLWGLSKWLGGSG